MDYENDRIIINMQTILNKRDYGNKRINLLCTKEQGERNRKELSKKQPEYWPHIRL